MRRGEGIRLIGYRSVYWERLSPTGYLLGIVPPISLTEQRNGWYPSKEDSFLSPSAFAKLLRCPKSVTAAFAATDFDRCAKPCSLYPPQAALAGFAANAGLACGLGHGAALTVHRTVIHSRAERFAFPP